jgi:hypothetical protein
LATPNGTKRRAVAAKEKPLRVTPRRGSRLLEHEIGLAGALRFAAGACASRAKLGRKLLGSFASSPPRWQRDACLDFIEFFRLNRSYRCVSVNSGGSWGRSRGRAESATSLHERASAPGSSSWQTPWPSVGLSLAKTHTCCGPEFLMQLQSASRQEFLQFEA